MPIDFQPQALIGFYFTYRQNPGMFSARNISDMIIWNSPIPEATACS